MAAVVDRERSRNAYLLFLVAPSAVFGAVVGAVVVSAIAAGFAALMLVVTTFLVPDAWIRRRIVAWEVLALLLVAVAAWVAVVFVVERWFSVDAHDGGLVHMFDPVIVFLIMTAGIGALDRRRKRRLRG